MAALEEQTNVVREMVQGGFTHDEIADFLKVNVGLRRGCSARSVRRLCEEQGITRRSGIDDSALRVKVAACTEQVSKLVRLVIL